MKKYTLLLLIAVSILSCKKQRFYSCDDQQWPDFGIYARNDSVIFCDTTRVNVYANDHSNEIVRSYKNKLEYLSKNRSGSGSEIIYDVHTGKILRTSFGPYWKTYRDKKLIIEPIRMFFYWDTQYEENNWIQTYFAIFHEEVYVENDSIKVSEKEFILEAPFVNQKAIQRAHDYYDETIDKKNNKSDYESGLWSLQEILLTCAINRDSLSRKRLINFREEFPLFDSVRLQESIDLLIRFEKRHN